MSLRCRNISILLLASLGFAVSGALAQINRANLNGTVTDPSGASIPNAKVEVVAPDTGFKRQTTTGSSGVYSISSLPTGTYDLTVSGNGFKTFARKGSSFPLARPAPSTCSSWWAHPPRRSRCGLQLRRSIRTTPRSQPSFNPDKWRTSPLTGATGPS